MPGLSRVYVAGSVPVMSALSPTGVPGMRKCNPHVALSSGSVASEVHRLSWLWQSHEHDLQPPGIRADIRGSHRGSPQSDLAPAEEAAAAWSDHRNRERS